MQESKYFRLEDITETALGEVRTTSIDWYGSKQSFSHQEPDFRLNGKGMAVFGGLALVQPNLWADMDDIGRISPLFLEKGITSTLWMRPDSPSPKQLADDGRTLKNKLAMNIGWLVKIQKNQTADNIRALEEAPAVVGFWADDEWINQPDLAVLSAYERPIILNAKTADLAAYQRVLAAFKALKKRPIILNAPMFHPRDYPELVSLQAIGHTLSDKNGQSIGGTYLPIISHKSQLNTQKNSFWQERANVDKRTQNWLIFHAQSQIYKAYSVFNIAFKGRKMPGYDADIVVLDGHFRPKTVIVGGTISLWENEFLHEYNGAGLKTWQ